MRVEFRPLVLIIVMLLLAVTCGDDDDETPTPDPLREQQVEEGEAVAVEPEPAAESAPAEGEAVAVEPEPAAESAPAEGASTAASSITSLETGTFAGEFWVNMKLSGPIPPPGEPAFQRYTAIVENDSGDTFGLSWQSRDRGEFFATSFCLQGSESCPTQETIVPTRAEINETMDQVTLFFSQDSVVDPAGMRVSAFERYGPSSDDLFQVDYQSAERFPFVFTERDPAG